MSKIIEIEELGFPKSLIIREKSLVSELIDTKDLVNELNEQLRQYNVSGQSEQLVDFLLHLNDKELINNHDFDYEKEAKKYLKKIN